MRISSFYSRPKPTISIEFFPPKTAEDEELLFKETVPALKKLGPSFFSVTYGAGGGTRDTTLRIVNRIRQEHGVEAMAHLTCSGTTRADIASVLDEAHSLGIENILALRGDPPKGEEVFKVNAEGFANALDLIHFIRERNQFGIGAACYPEGHSEAGIKHTDWDWAAAKVEAGADFLITQLFYDWSDFLDMESYLRHRKNVKVPIIPGILPFLRTAQIKRFTALCGSKIPGPMRRRLEDHAEDDDYVRKMGVEVCTEIASHLLKHGVAGLHFYCLNRVPSVQEVLHNLGLAPG